MQLLRDVIPLVSWGDREWFETVPVVCGFVLMVLGCAYRMVKGTGAFGGRRMGLDFMEGTSITALLLFAAALFSRDLTARMAEKNFELLAASIVFFSLLQLDTLFEGWKSQVPQQGTAQH